jgi:hypothetical protein
MGPARCQEARKDPGLYAVHWRPLYVSGRRSCCENLQQLIVSRVHVLEDESAGLLMPNDASCVVSSNHGHKIHYHHERCTGNDALFRQDPAFP